MYKIDSFDKIQIFFLKRNINFSDASKFAAIYIMEE
ncbi:hypothetical protein SAMN05444397_1183 [Flavobacterium aquidurense]|nr:hypothetical protein SAMN05444397_1183 [Flavobacterium aquidurense]